MFYDPDFGKDHPSFNKRGPDFLILAIFFGVIFAAIATGIVAGLGRLAVRLWHFVSDSAPGKIGQECLHLPFYSVGKF